MLFGVSRAFGVAAQLIWDRALGARACISTFRTGRKDSYHPCSAGASQVVFHCLHSKDFRQQELIWPLVKYLTFRIPYSTVHFFFRAIGFHYVPTISAFFIMSDVRALLKAKRQEARIQHPHASYTSTGQLRCTACQVAIKQASAWAGHVGSKSHREKVARERVSQAADREEEAARSTGKRKVEEDEDEDDKEVHPTSESKKRKVTPEDQVKPTPEHSSGFPSDFFSDPSRAPIRSVGGDLSDEDEDSPVQMPPAETSNPVDLEWQRFQQEMLTPAPTPANQRQEAFKRATVFAEPELLPENVLGLPAREPPVVDATVAEVHRNEEELRKRKEEDEKELIMDRLLEEERAQEEADAKVVLLRGRLDALKKRRNEAKAARAKKLQ